MVSHKAKDISNSELLEKLEDRLKEHLNMVKSLLSEELGKTHLKPENVRSATSDLGKKKTEQLKTDIPLRKSKSASQRKTDEKPPEIEEKLAIIEKFHIPQRLKSTWVVWHFDSSRTYAKNMQQSHYIRTMDDLKGLYKEVCCISQFNQGYDYGLFREGSKPAIVDKIKKHSGRWIVKSPKKDRKTELDKLWLCVALSVLKEEHKAFKNITGVMAHVRQKGDSIDIWTLDGMNEETILEIGQKLKEATGKSLQYEVFSFPPVKPRDVSYLYNI